MSEQVRLIAARIKELRQISGLSEEKCASALNVSPETYRMYESGNHDIPVGFLYELSKFFGVELTELLTGDAPKLHAFSVVRKNKGVHVQRRSQYEYESLAFNFAHKKAEPFMVTVKPYDDANEIPTNSHPGQEFNYVIEGSLKIMIGGHEIVLNEGDSVYFDSSQPHGMKALNGKKAKFIAVIIA